MAVSKKDRFEVFKRDSFRCTYCGKQPPEVTLELEHIIAKANGGEDTFDNYTTSCMDCNRGKGARPLSVVAPSAIERLASLQERLEELHVLKAQSRMAKALKQKTGKIRQELVNYWCTAFGVTSCNKQIITMMYNRLRWIDIESMKELIDSCAKRARPHCADRYMGGILRNRLSELGIDYKKEVGAR